MGKVKTSRRRVTTITYYQRLFRTADGVKVLHDLIRTHHMNSSTFRGDSYDAAFMEGERSVVLRILALLKTDTVALLKMIEAAEKEVEQDDQSLELNV